MPCGVAGRVVRTSSALNCQPCLGSLTQKPEAMIASLGCRSGSVPTRVTRRSSLVPEASVRSGTRRATV